MEILDKISLPQEVKRLEISDLDALAKDIREIITQRTMSNGGHLASNLGVVDLTVALSYVFDFPKDKLIFDVGHQCYAYKILTGRLKEFESLRKKGGLNGFTKREESPYDTVNSGHASTALSIACGMARGGEDGEIICLIGDGAMTGGLFYEALNDVLTLDKKVIIIINDNNMSISDNVGFVNEYLNIVRKYGNEIPFLGIETLTNINGHNVSDLIGKLRYAKNSKKTIILHVVTQKGKGIECAEKAPSKFHSVSAIKDNLPSYSRIFGEKLTQLANYNEDIFAITAAMIDGTGLGEFSKSHPSRLIDVGIAEGHAVTMAAGIALSGKKPYVAIYSTFLQRAYDHILHDVCLDDLPVTFCIDRAGFVGGDGETHQGLYDVAYLGSLPNMTVCMPKDGEELRQLLDWSVDYGHPLSVRYPKCSDCGGYETHTPIKYGRWENLKYTNADNVIISYGDVLRNAYEAAEDLKSFDINCDVVNARFINPIDGEFLKNCRGKNIFVLEECVQSGSLYSKVLSYISEHEIGAKVYGRNVENVPYSVAERNELIESVGLDKMSIIKFIEKKCGK